MRRSSDVGGHKGYGFLMVADLLGGALTGHGCTSLPEHTTGNGVFLMAIDIEAFCLTCQALHESAWHVRRAF